MKVVILSAQGNEAVRRCVNSLLVTAEDFDFDIVILRERGVREQTLNAAISLLGTGDDILLVGDDIEFTVGWLSALKQHEKNADIWGMSMLYPDKVKVQDRGYDLAEIHGRVLLEPRERGLLRGQVESFGWRYCDGVCGCFLYIRSNVFDKVHRFREKEGCNRWGEFVFISEARKAGARVGVVDHFLHHGGIGTKGHSDKSLSSISYRVEKDLWQTITENFVDPAWVLIRRATAVEPALLDDLRRSNQKILIYGIGTVTEALLYHLGETGPKFIFATGLPEESGMVVGDSFVYHIGDVTISDFDWILITPLYIGEIVCSDQIVPRLPSGFSGRVSIMETRFEGETIVYLTRDIVY